MSTIHSRSHRMKNVYLVAAIIGAVIPYFFFVQHFDAQGLSLIHI